MKFAFNSSEKNVEFCNFKTKILQSVAVQFKHNYKIYDSIYVKTTVSQLMTTNFHTITHQINTYKFKSIEPS